MAASKKARVVLAQPAAGAPAPRPPLSHARLAPSALRGGGGVQGQAPEAEAKKRKLHMERLSKQRLLAEVKFLRKRYKSMSENPSQTIVCRVRNPAVRPASRTAAWANDAPYRSVQAISSSSRNQPVQWTHEGSARVTPAIDLNEACEPGYEEMEMGDHHGYQEPLDIDKVRSHPMEGDAVAGPSEARIPAFWDARSQAGRAGKRKISWQDQALRV
ncbi:hypothetical protein HU200_061330 [Digitaria exilis]|uniref:Uncharacterized protein n=1 Tax=Digitaria exilis TaxID=1010633 RepID=A0A835DWP5_9POAL|nr:hypothetical protein HU200_061330 [Digitaria exilis]